MIFLALLKLDEFWSVFIVSVRLSVSNKLSKNPLDIDSLCPSPSNSLSWFNLDKFWIFRLNLSFEPWITPLLLSSSNVWLEANWIRDTRYRLLSSSPKASLFKFVSMFSNSLVPNPSLLAFSFAKVLIFEIEFEVSIFSTLSLLIEYDSLTSNVCNVDANS